MTGVEQGTGGPSQHPADRLIRELIGTGRQATPEEIARIIERMATAPFNRQVVRVPVDERGTTYRGQTLGARATSLAYHLVKRVVIERQWSDGTTEQRYLADLRQAVRIPDARLAVYERRGGAMAAILTATDRVVPTERLGRRPLPLLLVVYSADRGIIVSGYQISALNAAIIPEDALWLR